MLIYSTDFSFDPNWLTDQPTNFYWDEGTGTFVTVTINEVPDETPNRYAFIDLNLDTSQSFTVSWDYQILSRDGYGIVNFGLFADDFVAHNVRFNGRPHIISDSALNIGAGGTPSGSEHYAFNIYTGGTIGHGQGGSGPDRGGSIGVWYSSTVSFDAEAGLATWTLTYRDSGEVVLSITRGVSDSFAEEMTNLGIAHHPIGYHPNQIWAIDPTDHQVTAFDNIVVMGTPLVLPEPLEDMRYPVGESGYVTEVRFDDDYYQINDLGVRSTEGPIYHLGEDWNHEDPNVEVGQDVNAIFYGTVVYAEFHPHGDNGFGNLVVIEHQIDGRRVYSLYSHLNEINVAVDQYVAPGTRLGGIGMTGSAESPHLHFEIFSVDGGGSFLDYLVGGTPVDNAWAYTGVADPSFVDDTNTAITDIPSYTEGSITWFNPSIFIDAHRGVSVESSVDQEGGTIEGTRFNDSHTLMSTDTDMTITVSSSGFDVVLDYVEGARQFILEQFESIRFLGGTGADTVIIDDDLSGTSIQQNTIYFDGGSGNDELDGSLSSRRIVASGGVGDDLLGGGLYADLLTGGLGNDQLDGGSNVDTAVFSGNMADYTITQTATGVFRVVGADGTDTLTNIEFAQFDDQTMRLLPGQGVSVNFETSDPSVYQTALEGIRDFDGNDLGGDGSWLRIGSADVNGDGDIDQILVNDAIGRFATVGTAPDGLVYFEDHSWAGETRVAGIYIDPEVQAGNVVSGSEFDSQRRFQNDLEIENINRVLGANDYDGDGIWEVYFALTDGTAYLRALMHEDGNIRYANYQSEQEVIDYLTANGFDDSTYGDWFTTNAQSDKVSEQSVDIDTFTNVAPDASDKQGPSGTGTALSAVEGGFQPHASDIEALFAGRPFEGQFRMLDDYQVEFFG